jgi:D-sedoheptulose 7-phosphate isomerase
MARAHVEAVAAALAGLDLEPVERIATVLHAAHGAGHTVYCLGNGGSAATASHFAADLARLTVMPGRPRQLKAISISANTSSLTAAANDEGAEQMFTDQLQGRLERGDVVVAFSTRGASPNVLHALRHARAAGAVAVGVTGEAGALLRQIADEAITVRSSSIQVIEDVSSVVAHLLCLLTRERRLVAGD